MSTENDVPLGDGARRYYEQQFGARIRQVKKSDGVPRNDSGGSRWNGRAGCGIFVAVLMIVRLISAVVGTHSGSSYNKPSYNAPPPRTNFDVEAFRVPNNKADDPDVNEIVRQLVEGKVPPPAARGARVPEVDLDPLLTAEEVPLLEGLCYRIYQESLRRQASPGGHLMKLLAPRAALRLVQAAKGLPLDGRDREEVLDGLSAVLQRADFWEPAVFGKVPAVQELLRFREEFLKDLLTEEFPHFTSQRRLVLDVCYPEQIVPVAERGQLDLATRERWRQRAQLDLDKARREYEPNKH